MLSKMKTKQVQSTQLVAICVEEGEGLVFVCTHHTCGMFSYLENIFGRIYRKLVILIVSGKRDDKG